MKELLKEAFEAGQKNESNFEDVYSQLKERILSLEIDNISVSGDENGSITVSGKL